MPINLFFECDMRLFET